MSRKDWHNKENNLLTYKFINPNPKNIRIQWQNGMAGIPQYIESQDKDKSFIRTNYVYNMKQALLNELPKD